MLMAERTNVVSDARAKPRAETARHAWVRFTAGQAVYCQPMTVPTANKAKRGWWGRLRNISSAGLGVRLSRPFEPGTLLIIELTDKRKRRTYYFPVRVVHATAEGNRLWLIGCAFIRPLSENEVEGLVGE
jgi:hypothetical protein